MTNLANRLPDSQPPLSAAAFNARRDINRDKYAASGYIEPGKSLGIEPTLTRSNGGGLWTSNNITQAIRLGRPYADGYGDGDSENTIYHVDGIIIHLCGINWSSEENNHVLLPPAPMAYPEASTITTQDYKQGDHVVVGNNIYVCIHPDGSVAGVALTDDTYYEVRDVVSREDLVGMEVFLVELSEDDVDAVYPYGNVHYTPTTWKRQTLYSSVMPQTYSAFYTGDTATIGRGMKWSTMTPEERNWWASDPVNNIYVEDGKYYQWQYRLRSVPSRGGFWKIACAWDTTVSAIADGRDFVPENPTHRYYAPQGKLEEAGPYFLTVNEGYPFNYMLTTQHFSFPKETTLGVAACNSEYVTDEQQKLSANGRVYHVGLARVTRLNMGGYHPFYNPTGTRTFRRQDINGDNRWENINTFQPKSVADCFKIGPTAQSEGIYEHSGFKISNHSGHPQDYRHDNIYDWQVKDLRMSAHGIDITPDELARKLISTHYRGWERAMMMKVSQGTIATKGIDRLTLDINVIPDHDGIETRAFMGGCWLYNKTKGEVFSFTANFDTEGNELFFANHPELNPEILDNPYGYYSDGSHIASWETGDEVVAINFKRIRYYGNRLEKIDLICTPEKLVETFEYFNVDRVIGMSWIPEMLGSNGNEGVSCRARRRVENALPMLKSDNAGQYWTLNGYASYLQGFESPANTATIVNPATDVLMLMYNTPATAVYYTGYGIGLLDGEYGAAHYTGIYRADNGGTLCYGLTGKITTGDTNPESVSYELLRSGMGYADYFNFDYPESGLYGSIFHTDITIKDTDEDGVKFVPFLTYDRDAGAIYGQGFFKEVRNLYRDDVLVEVDLSQSTVSINLSKGDRFKMINSPTSGLTDIPLVALKDININVSASHFDGWQVGIDDGRIYRKDGYFWDIAAVDPVSKSGDDSIISNAQHLRQGTDLNGNIISYGSFRTDEILGFVPRHKRRKSIV